MLFWAVESMESSSVDQYASVGVGVAVGKGVFVGVAVGKGVFVGVSLGEGVFVDIFVDVASDAASVRVSSSTRRFPAASVKTRRLTL